MTMQDRQNIFAKEYLSIKDIEMLFDMSYPQASKMITDIKKRLTVGLKQELRLSVQGKLHVQDYLDWLGVRSDRYAMVEIEGIDEYGTRS
jgi:hypothetical protein